MLQHLIDKGKNDNNVDMLKISDYSEYDYAADFEDEVDSVQADSVIVGGSTGIQGQSQPPPPPLEIAEAKVELRSFFPEDWLFSLEQTKQTPVFER